MKTVGEIFKKARSEKKITLDQVEKEIKIRKKFLQALENNSWTDLPPLPYIKGFIRNYSKYLSLEPEEMVAFFRRQYLQENKSGLLPKGLIKPLNSPYFDINPHFWLFLLIGLFVFLFFGYLFIQYQSYNNPPNLIILEPIEGLVTNNNQINVSGKTDSDAVVSINSVKIALNSAGEFNTKITLSPGSNSIIIEAVKKNGKSKSITRNIQKSEISN
jgi:cytoskeletal protein RodZ